MTTKTFTFYWLDGSRNVASGASPEDALTHAGFGAGAVRALDFWANGDNADYYWDKSEGRWTWTPEYAAKVMGSDHAAA